MKFTIVVAALLSAVSAQKLTQSQAASRLSAAGITASSSGGCTNRQQSTCTSYEQINSASVSGAVTLKNACACAVTITGGTEIGHASGTYSHYNGYKIDFKKTAALNSYVTNTFTRIENRGSYPQYQARSGNIYCDEGNHWDVTFYSDGS